MQEGLLDSNPVIGTNQQAEHSRDRVLSNDELRQIWNALDGSSAYAAIVRILMLTGQRRAEIALCAGRKSSVIKSSCRDTHKEWPRARHSADHRCADHPRGAPAHWRGCLWPESGISRLGLEQGRARPAPPRQRRRARALDASRSATFDGHSHGRSGTPPHVIEAILNHVGGTKAGVAGIYNRARHEAAKRAALEKWAAHVKDWLAADCVKSRELARMDLCGRPERLQRSEPA